MTGIVGCELVPSTMSVNMVLGPAADNYLWAHGYQPGSIQLIQRSYERATDMESFVNQLADAGVPIAEGHYVFSLIHEAL